jgi:hypothetical protein
VRLILDDQDFGCCHALSLRLPAGFLAAWP